MPSATRYPLGETYRADYARKEIRIRGELRKVLNNILVVLTGDHEACMHWSLAQYCKRIFIKYRLRLVGWPHDIVFTNLSDVTGSERILRLFALWESGVLRFVPVDDDEVEAARRNPLTAAPGPLHLGLPRGWGRNDIGKRRRRPITDPDGTHTYRYVRDGPKTPRVVSGAADMRADREYEEGLIAARG
ncbi:hypothetical protein V8D89_000588 [Ganoderma adspersum]